MGVTKQDKARLTHKTRLAHYLWEERGRPLNGWEVDSAHANWMANNLLPYAVIERSLSPEEFGTEITSLHTKANLPQSGVVTVIVALDGAPEYSQSAYQYASRVSPNNGMHPENWIERKDGEFYRHCCAALALYDGTILDQQGQNGESWEAGSEERVSQRKYQDACIAAFCGDRPLHSAINAALHLRRVLAAHNEERNESWIERLHPRLVIGSTPESAVSSFESVWRDEIVVDPESLASLPRDYQELLFSTGVRVGLPICENGHAL